MDARKTKLMAQFYEQCQAKGYTDMHNDVQSLKAKVIAVDLGLDYKDIIVFYEKAKGCYETVQREAAEAEKRRRIREEQEKAEAVRRAVDGRLLVTILGDDKKQMQICLRPDGTFYTQKEGSRIEGVPSFVARKGGSVQYDYNPSKMVFTGAASGNIAMGGIHQTQASYSEKFTTSGKGYIEAKIQEKVITVTEITMSQYTRQRFHRDEAFQRIAPNGYISCVRFSDTANMLARSAVSGTGNIYSQMSLLTMAADEKRIPYADCVEIVKLLQRVAHGKFPPTDEEIYARATERAKRNTSVELNRAIEEFRIISNYKDSAQQIRLLQDLYDEVLQREKEQAILEKEAAEKNRKVQRKKTITRMLVCTIVLILMVAALTLFTEVVLPEKYYKEAEVLLANGQYEEALAAFEARRGYKDSASKALECVEGIRATNYRSAEELLAAGDFFHAATAFYSLGDYRDAWERCSSIWGQITQREVIDGGSDCAIGLKADGTVVSLGLNQYDQKEIAQWKDIVAVHGDWALRADGKVMAWGYNEYDYGNERVRSWCDIVAISDNIGLKADGTVVAMGTYSYGVNSWQNIVAVSAGSEHFVGLTTDGTVVAEGRNEYAGQCEVSGWKDIVAINAGSYHTVGLKKDGTVVAVGKNDEGQCEVSGWTDIVAISAGNNYTLGLRSDGTVVATEFLGNYYTGQCEVADWTDIVAISTGGGRTMGLKADGTVVETVYTGYRLPSDDGLIGVNKWSDIKLPQQKVVS